MKKNDPVEVFDHEKNRWSDADVFTFVEARVSYVVVLCIKGTMKGLKMHFKRADVRMLSRPK